MADALAALRDRAAQKTAADPVLRRCCSRRAGRLCSSRPGDTRIVGRREPQLDTQFHGLDEQDVHGGCSVLQLVDAGKLSLQGTVGRYLPDYPTGPYRRCRARSLPRRRIALQHGSGAFIALFIPCDGVVGDKPMLAPHRQRMRRRRSTGTISIAWRACRCSAMERLVAIPVLDVLSHLRLACRYSAAARCARP